MYGGLKKKEFVRDAATKESKRKDRKLKLNNKEFPGRPSSSPYPHPL